MSTIVDVHPEPVLGGPPVYSPDGRWTWTGSAWERRDPDADTAEG
ncbi:MULTISPECIES: hypothetical protein [Nocardioides]|uniref:Uncharacterized protein n=1 Tax=Nocardioides lianchengensis TaxID=1045774 RepID=A0A1G6XZN2_9ACTN|nr:hypothetical protein [Nocardioides lianchengensis]NYG13477.1 hypothetical protein [Nocardioides lianchengensis]SDD82835.1 hypothetical protein SAMN05421872_111123 [Nocardioides lianchengensis]